MYAPVEPHGVAHSRLMDHLHGLMGHPHVTAPHKADYAKAQSILAALQAKMHAEPQQGTSAAPGQMGGVQAPEDNGGLAGQMLAPPGYQFQIGQQADARNPLLSAFRPRIAAQSPLFQALAARFG